MKIVCISDTHNKLSEITLPDGDILIHSGDWLARGDMREFFSFIETLKHIAPRYKAIVTTPGNHDFVAEKHPQLVVDTFKEIPNVHYLNDSGVTIDGVKFWGSPVSPRFFDWAFNRDRGENIKRHWDLIPKDTNVLVTHSPPMGILDTVRMKHSPNFGENVGCDDLRKTIDTLPDLKLHVFGHIHTENGNIKVKDVTFINASCLNDKYNVAFQPWIINI